MSASSVKLPILRLPARSVLCLAMSGNGNASREWTSSLKLGEWELVVVTNGRRTKGQQGGMWAIATAS